MKYFGQQFSSLSATLLFFLLVFVGCQNELLTEINHFYDPTLEDDVLFPPEITALNIASADLTLISTLSGGKTVTWDTSRHGGIDSVGALIQPNFSEPDVTGEIIATIRYKSGRTSQHSFTVIVPAMVATDAEAVAAASALLMIGYQPGDSANSITRDLTLPLSGLHGTTLSWDASALTSVADDGTVTQPSFTAGNNTGALVATVSKGSETVNVSFPITVLKLPVTDLESVTLAGAALSIGYQVGDSSSSVTGDLTLLSTGLHGTIVRWDASALTSVTDAGVVSRPSFTDGNEAGIIIATVTKGSETNTVNFPITVARLSINDIESVNAAIAALSIGYQGADTSTSISRNLVLPLTGLQGTTITWDASALSSITNDGTVNRPSYTAGNESGTIVATVRKGAETDTVNFPVTVLALPITNAESVTLASAAIQVIYSSGDTSTSVTGDLTLSTTGLHGTSVAWNAAALSSVTNTGTVSRPSFVSGNESGTLVATVSKGSETNTLSFSITVLRLNPTDLESVTAAAAALAITYASGDSSSSITENLTLPLTGLYGTTVVWDASGLSSVSDSGGVSRPTFTAGDESGNIRATVTKGTETAMATFYVIVTALPVSDSESVTLAAAALSLTFTPGDSASAVTGNLNLPTTGLHGTTVRWNASALSTVSDSGVVSRPAFPGADQTGNLVATIEKGGESATQTFTITVLRVPPTDAEAVNEVVSNIMDYIEFTDPDTSSSITQDLTLKTIGDYGTTLSWTSTHARISNIGVVNTTSTDWFIPAGSFTGGRLQAQVSRGAVRVMAQTGNLDVEILTAPSIPVPSGFSISMSGGERFLEFTRPANESRTNYYRVEYREFTGSWGDWTEIPPGTADASSSTVRFGWTTAQLATGDYQFRVRLDALNAGIVFGNWGTSSQYTSF
ncbi:MAG: hypothetical protein MI717_07465 [Spirochaetales bacterium]|nr:hypothetical protein [Spirochaetales bacterium]